MLTPEEKAKREKILLKRALELEKIYGPLASRYKKNQHGNDDDYPYYETCYEQSGEDLFSFDNEI